jgi:glycosyltransferase involved in cell wall biosynthesis
MSDHCVALLGRTDHPTDAVEEYCRYLSEALRSHDFELELARVNWDEHGWSGALTELRRNASNWSGQWVLVQYTALAWSKRGFPVNFLRALRALSRLSARVAVVYHDAEPYAGRRWIDKMRSSVQVNTMRRALLASNLAILTVPPKHLRWLTAYEDRAVFIPVGANLPADSVELQSGRLSVSAPTVAVFGITGGAAGEREAKIIIETMKLTAKKLGKLKLRVFGRHAELREALLRSALRDFPVEIEVSGVIPAAEVAGNLHSSDVLLFVRGPISTRRGSAIAGIACGLPIVAYGGPETTSPVTEAGVVLVSPGTPEGFAAALIRLLLDKTFHDALAAKSREAYQKYFSWPAIAAAYAEALRQRP